VSSPFDPEGTSGAVVGTVGAPTGFLDNYQATLQEAANNERYLGAEDEVQSGWQKSIRALRQRGIEVPENSPLRLIEDTIDPTQSRPITRAFLGVDTDSPAFVARFKAAEQVNEQIKTLNDPNIPSIDQIIQQVKDARAGRVEHATEIESASDGIGGWFGRLAGGVTSAFTDPAQVPTLLAGGFGKTVAMRLATGVAANAAVAAGIQGEFANQQHQLLGEPQGSVGEAALYGGLAGLVIGGAHEGLGALAHTALAKAQLPDVHFNFDDPQLRSMFNEAPDSPVSRAGIEALNDNVHFEASNPYPDTEAGLRRFTGEAADIVGAFGGTSTAIGRFLPPLEDFTLDTLDFHTQVVKEQSPEIFGRVEEATRRVNELDEQINAAQEKLDGLSVSDALTQVDQTTGDLVRSYEEELARPNLSNEDRAALEQKIQGITESVQATPPDLTPQLQEAEARLAAATTKAEALAAARDLDKLHKAAGVDVLQRAMSQAERPIRDNLKGLKASRKAAAKEFRAARNAMDKEIERIKAEERAKELLKPQQGLGTERGPFDVEAMRSDRVDEAVKTTDEAHAAKADYGDDLIHTEEPAKPAEGEPEVTLTVPEEWSMLAVG
jgi:hypothetical protein